MVQAPGPYKTGRWSNPHSRAAVCRVWLRNRNYGSVFNDDKQSEEDDKVT